MTLILDKDDRDALVQGIKGTFITKANGTLSRAGLYAAYSSICLGKNAGVYIMTNFKMAFDLLDAIFDDCQYNTLGITDATNAMYVFKPPIKPAPVVPKAPSRAKDSTVAKFRKSTGAKAFMGKRFKFKVPTAKAANLYKSGFKTASPRRTATMLFPFAATNDQVACWFSTHQTISVASSTNVVRIVSEKGTALSVPATMTTTEHDRNIGSFDLATKFRLDGTKTGVELAP